MPKQAQCSRANLIVSVAVTVLIQHPKIEMKAPQRSRCNVFIQCEHGFHRKYTFRGIWREGVLQGGRQGILLLCIDVLLPYSAFLSSARYTARMSTRSIAVRSIGYICGLNCTPAWTQQVS